MTCLPPNPAWKRTLWYFPFVLDSKHSIANPPIIARFGGGGFSQPPLPHRLFTLLCVPGIVWRAVVVNVPRNGVVFVCRNDDTINFGVSLKLDAAAFRARADANYVPLSVGGPTVFEQRAFNAVAPAPPNYIDREWRGAENDFFLLPHPCFSLSLWIACSFDLSSR